MCFLLFFKNSDVAHSEPPSFECNKRHCELLTKTSASRGEARAEWVWGWNHSQAAAWQLWIKRLNCSHLTAILKNKIKKKTLPQHMCNSLSSWQHQNVCGHSLILMEHCVFLHMTDGGDGLFNVPSAQHICWCNNRLWPHGCGQRRHLRYSNWRQKSLNTKEL